MKHLRVSIECLSFLLVVGMVNGASLTEIIGFGRFDASLIESISSGEDELRYLAKIKEATEGRWLMGNPAIKEYNDEGFSPSGFMEWAPALMLRASNNNWGLVLIITDLLCTGIVILLTRLWIGKFVKNPIAVWACMFALFFTTFGGSLFGLLRDVVPKFVQPFASLYLLLLALPGRHTVRQTLMRSALVGMMFYTYPYHWSLFIVCEGLLFCYRLWIDPSIGNNVRRFFARAIREAAVSFVPFIILALPMAIAMRIALSAPGLDDFYSRYHIVFTHIPAAPRLQLIIAMTLIVLVCAALVRGTKARYAQLLQNEMLGCMVPLLAMMILLYSNVITGKDPELLGHGGRVIMPVVTLSFFTAAEWILQKKSAIKLAGMGVLLFFGVMAIQTTIAQWRLLHSNYDKWEAASERDVLTWLHENLEPELIIAAPRSLSETIPVFTSHYVSFNAAAHFFFVPTDELTDRYLGWVGLYPEEKEPTDTATVIIFGNHPGAQWSKERTLHNILSDEPFAKTMADYIPRQDLRQLIDEEHANPDPQKTRTRLEQYDVDVVIRKNNVPPAELLEGFEHVETIGPYELWRR